MEIPRGTLPAPALPPQPAGSSQQAEDLQQALLDALARAQAPVPPRSSPVQRPCSALDGVPISSRRRLEDAEGPEQKRSRYSDAPVASEQLPALTMLARTSSDPAWFTREACSSWSVVMGLDVQCVCVLFHVPLCRAGVRVCVMPAAWSRPLARSRRRAC